MTVALCIIAICEVIRALQNMVQIMATRHDLSQMDNAYAEFVKSIKQSDRDFVRNMLVEFEKQDGKQEDTYIPYDERVNIVQWLARFCRHIDNGDEWLDDEHNLAFFKAKMKQQFGWDTDDITLG